MQLPEKMIKRKTENFRRTKLYPKIIAAVAELGVSIEKVCLYDTGTSYYLGYSDSGGVRMIAL